VTEGTWAVPDTPAKINRLKELLSKDLPVGPDATFAVEQLYDIVGDDDLFDDLSELAKSQPDADARPLVVKRLKELGYDLDQPEPAAEDLDTDGVMMTRPSTMSNESIERLKYLSNVK
jgi:hypothetical protein